MPSPHPKIKLQILPPEGRRLQPSRQPGDIFPYKSLDLRSRHLAILVGIGFHRLQAIQKGIGEGAIFPLALFITHLHTRGGSDDRRPGATTQAHKELLHHFEAVLQAQDGLAFRKLQKKDYWDSLFISFRIVLLTSCQSASFKRTESPSSSASSK